jgi:lipopolysaccharide biosynthesis glycosyltransferase
MIPADTVLLRKVYGDASLATSASAFHIALGIDENYARCMGVLLVSLLAANPDTPLIFHVFTESIKPEDLQRISSLTENRRTTITLYYINKSALAELPASGHYSTAVYYRIVMPSILGSLTDRVLYLDSDIICLGSLSGLAGLDLNDRAVAAVQDVQRVVVEKVSELKLQSQFYFNSGVMLIDIAKWNEADISSRVLQVLAGNKTGFSLVDQDALNIVLDGNVLPLPPIWNQVYDLGQMTHDPVAGTIFLHYTGAVKPWRLSGRHRLSNWYRNFENASPWAGSPLLAPTVYKEMEIYARLALKSGDLPTASVWYWKYLQAKFFNHK